MRVEGPGGGSTRTKTDQQGWEESAFNYEKCLEILLPDAVMPCVA